MVRMKKTIYLICSHCKKEIKLNIYSDGTKIAVEIDHTKIAEEDINEGYVYQSQS